MESKHMRGQMNTSTQINNTSINEASIGGKCGEGLGISTPPHQARDHWSSRLTNKRVVFQYPLSRVLVVVRKGL